VSYYLGKKFEGQTLATATDLCLYLLENAHVAVVTGEAFGDDNSIRISYAASEQMLREAIKRISKALNDLQ